MCAIGGWLAVRNEVAIKDVVDDHFLAGPVDVEFNIEAGFGEEGGVVAGAINNMKAPGGVVLVGKEVALVI